MPLTLLAFGYRSLTGADVGGHGSRIGQLSDKVITEC